MDSLLQSTDFALIALLLVVFYQFARARNIACPTRMPIVPTRIPWLGSAMSFVFRRTSFLDECRLRHGPAYKFFVAGRHVVVVSSPELISNVVETSPKVLLSFEEKGLELMGGLSEGLPRAVQLLHRTTYSFLSAGLTKRSMGTITVPMNNDLFNRLYGYTTTQGEACVHLREFVGRNLYHTSSAAFFGAILVPDTFSDFSTMDDGMFFMSNQMKFLSPGAYGARSRMADVLTQYIQEAWTGDDDFCIEEASPIISNSIREFRKGGMSMSEAARLLVYLIWGFNSNLIHTTVNALAYLLIDPAVYHSVVADTRKALYDTYPDFEMLLNAEPDALDCDAFAILDSIIQESLRISSLASSFREALRDVHLEDGNGQSYFIQKGDLVIADVRGMHYDPSILPNPHAFIADRFLVCKETNKMRGAKTFRPWGGGNYICRGREFAQYAAKMFLLQIIYLFDIAPGEIEPSLEINHALVIARLRGSPVIRLRKRTMHQ
ncbi:hypothetical protein ACEPAH_4026 [Sanghuangporus vaninii]